MLKLIFPLPNDALCQVRFKFAQWFWRGEEGENVKSLQTDRQTDGCLTTGDQKFSFQLKIFMQGKITSIWKTSLKLRQQVITENWNDTVHTQYFNKAMPFVTTKNKKTKINQSNTFIYCYIFKTLHLLVTIRWTWLEQYRNLTLQDVINHPMLLEICRNWLVIK